MNQFEIIDAADQQFGARLSDRRVTIRVRYNVTTDRWSFDLSIDNLPVLFGRRIVTGVDLLRPYNFGIGLIFAYPTEAGDVPDRAALPGGTVRLYHATQAEVDAPVPA